MVNPDKIKIKIVSDETIQSGIEITKMPDNKRLKVD